MNRPVLTRLSSSLILLVPLLLLLLFLPHKNYKLINSIWNKEELPDQWKESIIVPVHKKCDKTDCSNYRGTSLLSTSYKMLSNILLSRLSPYIDEIIGDHGSSEWVMT
jgi:hypothetical protein